MAASIAVVYRHLRRIDSLAGARLPLFLADAPQLSTMLI